MPLATIVLIPCALYLGCVAPIATNEDKNPVGNNSFAVYVLSRGSGVPEATRAALGTVRDLLEDLRREGQIARLEETRIGLEGETRVCVEFKEALAAREAIERVRKIASGVELLNVVEEPCDKR